MSTSKCIICKEFLQGKVSLTLGCGHTYHKQCVETKVTCPECNLPTGLKVLTQKERNNIINDLYGMSICIAAERGEYAIVRDMIIDGCTICECAISRAAYKGHLNVINCLLENNAIFEDDALMHAVRGQREDIVQLFIDHKAPPSPTALVCALQLKNAGIVSKLLK